jgi:co-chaperonin GroES (HSP10)
MKNESGLKPLGCAVLLSPYEPEFMATRIAIPETAAERATMVETRAVVVEVGPAAWADEIRQGFPPRAKPGDKVLIARLSGAIVQGTADGKKYRMVNDRDIYSLIEVEANG